MTKGKPEDERFRLKLTVMVNPSIRVTLSGEAVEVRHVLRTGM